MEDKTLKDVTPTLIGIATDITESTYPFATVFSNASDKYQDLKLVDMALSSSSAPSFYKQHSVYDQSLNSTRTYIDGGISNCDPSIQCIVGL